MSAQQLPAVSLVETGERPGGVNLVDSNRTTFHGQTDLIDLARQIQQADRFTRANACNKLTLIAEQVRHLQKQARKVLDEAKRDDDLHHVACNFKRQPGQVYHLYSKPSGQRYFSMLSPLEWGSGCPHNFLGSYRLEHDMSWTDLRDTNKQRRRDLQMLLETATENLPMITNLGFERNDQ